MTDARTTKIGFGKRLLTAAASLVMLATCAVTAMPAHAENTNVAVNGTQTTFNKYLVMDANANVPNATFTFRIAAGTAVDATTSTPAIYAGVGTPTVGNAVFEAGDNTTNGLPTDTSSSGPTDGKKYATEAVIVDFSKVTFTAPGIYRYTITENNTTTQQGVSYDSSLTRTLDVYVNYTGDTEQDITGQLAVTNYVLHANATENPDTAAKSAGFTNTYATKDLTLTKEVTGNQGDRDKYFKFKVELANCGNGTQYDVAVPTGLVEDDLEVGDLIDDVNKTTLKADEDGTVTAYYYLKDGESIVIKGMTEGTKYTITETDYSTDGYTTTNTDNTTDGKTTGDKTMGTSAHTVTFTNAKQGTVPTGILLDVAPYIVLVALVGVGLIALLATKKRRSR